MYPHQPPPSPIRGPYYTHAQPYGGGSSTLSQATTQVNLNVPISQRGLMSFGYVAPHEGIPMSPKYHPPSMLSSSNYHSQTHLQLPSVGAMASSSSPSTSSTAVGSSSNLTAPTHHLPPRSPKTIPRTNAAMHQEIGKVQALGSDSSFPSQQSRPSTSPFPINSIGVTIATSSYSDYDNLSGVLNQQGSMSPTHGIPLRVSSSSNTQGQEPDGIMSHKEVEEAFFSAVTSQASREYVENTPCEATTEMESPKAVRVAVIRSTSAVTSSVTGVSIPNIMTPATRQPISTNQDCGSRWHPLANQTPSAMYLKKIPFHGLSSEVPLDSKYHVSALPGAEQGGPSSALTGLPSVTSSSTVQRVKSNSHPHLPPSISNKLHHHASYLRQSIPTSQVQNMDPRAYRLQEEPVSTSSLPRQISFHPTQSVPMTFTQHQQMILQWLMQENTELRQRLLEHEQTDAAELEILAHKLNELQLSYVRLNEIHDRQCALENELSRRSQINDTLLQQENESLRKFLSQMMHDVTTSRSSVNDPLYASGTHSQQPFVPQFTANLDAFPSRTPYQQSPPSFNAQRRVSVAPFTSDMGYENLVSSGIYTTNVLPSDMKTQVTDHHHQQQQQHLPLSGSITTLHPPR